MKKVAIGVLAASLILTQGLQTEAKSKKSTLIDKDKNGIHDDWQKKYKLGKGKSVAQKDPDKDGLSNVLEYQLNTIQSRRTLMGIRPLTIMKIKTKTA